MSCRFETRAWPGPRARPGPLTNINPTQPLFSSGGQRCKTCLKSVWVKLQGPNGSSTPQRDPNGVLQSDRKWSDPRSALLTRSDVTPDKCDNCWKHKATNRKLVRVHRKQKSAETRPSAQVTTSSSTRTKASDPSTKRRFYMNGTFGPDALWCFWFITIYILWLNLFIMSSFKTFLFQFFRTFLWFCSVQGSGWRFDFECLWCRLSSCLYLLLSKCLCGIIFSSGLFPGDSFRLDTGSTPLTLQREDPTEQPLQNQQAAAGDESRVWEWSPVRHAPSK